VRKFYSVLWLLVPILAACQSEASPTVAPTLTSTPKQVSTPTPTPAPLGKTIIVENTEDSGTGSFRAVLTESEPHDTIVFNPDVFKPGEPATISILGPLPELNKHHLTIDASNAGVILDGGGRPFGALSINAEQVTVQGLRIVNFDGTAITLWENAHYNAIGGEPGASAGSLGQGNLISGNRDGIIIQEGGSHHTIAGNLIGVEFNGFVSNTYSGIKIDDHSPGNVIGPDNIIAYSGAPSIDIGTGATEGTTITRNLIYGEETVLRMVPPTANFAAAPVMLSYDPAGTVSGIACPGCKVEIFSGEDRWAEFYEGSITAGQDGSFTFNAGHPFSGANLKATATLPNGSTSQFSLPTPGESGRLIIQDGNSSLAETLITQSSRDILQDNRMGTHGFYPYCWLYCLEDAPFLDDLGGMGYKRIRLSFNEMEQAYGLNDQSEYLDEKHEDCIHAFHSQGMTISYIISFWNKAARNAGDEVPCERFTNVGSGDPETEDYLQYVRDIVSFLSQRGVHEYEIWNEPDNYACTQGIRPENYIKLVELLVPEIRAIDPKARIFVGATTGTHAPDSAAYMRAIAAADEIMPIVDGLTWHPFYGLSPAYPDVADYYYGYPDLVDELKTLAASSGFSGEYRADEMMWQGHATADIADPGQPWFYELLEMPKYYVRAILVHLGMDIAAGVNVNSHGYPMVVYAVRNLSTVMAGHRVADLDVTIESDADNILSYGFTMSNGDRLFTLWTNGAAVEYDPGVSAVLTFTFEDSTPTSVTGIDVLHGYTQPLAFEVDGNQLVVPDLRVKDYPMPIRFGYNP